MTAGSDEGRATGGVASASVVPLREGDAGLEALLLRRSSCLAFGGGAWVFPGGRIDHEDRCVDGEGAADRDLRAARRAAAREAAEEAGLDLDPGQLVPVSHWLAPAGASRRFATWLFAVAADGTDVVVDDGEIVEHVWLTPRDALARRDRGDLELMPPTWVTLHELTAHDHVAAALAALPARTPFMYETRVVDVDGILVCLPAGDAGYEDGDPHRPGPRRRPGWPTRVGARRASRTDAL